MATTHEYDYSITNHRPTTGCAYHTTKPPTTHLSIRNTSTTDTTLITIPPKIHTQATTIHPCLQPQSLHADSTYTLMHATTRKQQISTPKHSKHKHVRPQAYP